MMKVLFRLVLSTSLFIWYAILGCLPLYEVGDTAVTNIGYISHGDGLGWINMPYVVDTAPLIIWFLGICCMLGTTTMVFSSAYPFFHAASVYVLLSAFLFVLFATLSFADISDIVPSVWMFVAMIPFALSANVVSSDPRQCVALRRTNVALVAMMTACMLSSGHVPHGRILGSAARVLLLSSFLVSCVLLAVPIARTTASVFRWLQAAVWKQRRSSSAETGASGRWRSELEEAK